MAKRTVPSSVEPAEQALAEARRQLARAMDERERANRQVWEAHVAVEKATVEARGESWGEALPPEPHTSRHRLRERWWEERTAWHEQPPGGRAPSMTVDEARAACDRAWALVDDLAAEQPGAFAHRLEEAYLDVMLTMDGVQDARQAEAYEYFMAEAQRGKS